MSIAARLRLALARSPWLYWAIVAVLAGDRRAVRDARRQRRRDGPPVVGRDTTRCRRPPAVEPGGRSRRSAEPRQLPAPMVPADAVTELATDAVARQRIAAGEVIVTHDVVAHAAPQSLIPQHWLAVAIAEPVASGARVGDGVTVTAGGVVIAAEGVVVGLAGEALLVAVPADEAPQVAHAASTGDVAVLLTP